MGYRLNFELRSSGRMLKAIIYLKLKRISTSIGRLWRAISLVIEPHLGRKIDTEIFLTMSSCALFYRTLPAVTTYFI